MHSFMTRRQFARYAGLSLLGASGSGWLSQLAAATSVGVAKPRRSCILLWMSGGPSQMETFDPKPGNENGGPTKSIETAVSGIRIAENLPKVAQHMKSLAPIRSMSTREGDHQRATYYMRTGYLPQGPVQYPAMGAFLGKELRQQECDLPSYVSISPFRAFSPLAYGPGFLGPAWSPLVVAAQQERASQSDQPPGDGTAPSMNEVSFEVQNLKVPEAVSSAQVDARLSLLAGMEHRFLSARPDNPGVSHLQSYDQAVRMMKSSAVGAFDLSQEDESLRDAYGRNAFGQGCLLARRLIEHQVSFVEVTLNGLDANPGAGWDTHADNFDSVKALCEILDPAWATLMSDLEQRGLLESTLVVWMGEFGRTPKINENTGRDHWPGSWSTVLGGGGIRGGQVYGATSEDGMEITQTPVSVPNLMATICSALGLDPASTNLSNIGRPIPLADHEATTIRELIAGD
ncbi:MAG: DUF1501 domain-containing protein [Planctomycetaceae bacterium]|nr:DUF1501 domain-containing protein [Planctomycetaceae bacterium]